MDIPTRIDMERGCGWRVPGGMYLVTTNSYTGCERLPLRLDRCPTCDHGVKPARGWSWINAEELFKSQPCQQRPECVGCLLCSRTAVTRVVPCPGCGHISVHDNQEVYCSEKCDCDRTAVDGFWRPALQRAGLLWVGEKFYKTPEHFTHEAASQGISRRIHQIPREFIVGETIVLMAHRKAVPVPMSLRLKSTDDEFAPGIFMVTRPTHIEYIVKGSETDDELQALIERGITPVHVMRRERQTDLFASDDILVKP